MRAVSLAQAAAEFTLYATGYLSCWWTKRKRAISFLLTSGLSSEIPSASEGSLWSPTKLEGCQPSLYVFLEHPFNNRDPSADYWRRCCKEVGCLASGFQKQS